MFSDWAVFKNALELKDGSVRGINAKGQGGMPRKKIDKLVDFAKDYGAKGLPYIAIQPDGTVKLIDFGIARLYSDHGEKDTRIMGTEHFAPPEQYGFRQTDCRSYNRISEFRFRRRMRN